jgi:RNA-directed DNA polymerase
MVILFFDESFNSSWRILSWEKSLNNLFRLQRRLFISFFVSDIKRALSIQKLILKSNSARLLAIRDVTQISSSRKIAGIDGKTFLTFRERFELNEKLKLNFNNWEPNVLRKVFISNKDSEFDFLLVPTISDRVWHSLVKFSIEPIHESTFHTRSFGFRRGRSVHQLQKVIFLHLSKNSYGFQKRFMYVHLSKIFLRFDHTFLLRSIVSQRGIKIGISRCLNLGFCPEFLYKKDNILELESLFSNILINNIEKIHSCVRYGCHILFFLKPFDHEKIILKKIIDFLQYRFMNYSDIQTYVFSGLIGFDFLDWHFKVFQDGSFFSTPSFGNYQKFLKRVKHIINNSNYGAVCF